MRWIAVLLVVANLALWWFLTSEPVSEVESDASGRLPRVAELEVLGVDGSPASPEESAPASNLVREAEPGMVADGSSAYRPEAVVNPPEVAEVDEVGESNPGGPEVNGGVPVPAAAQASGIEVPRPTDFCIELGWFDDERAALGALGQIDIAGRVEELSVEERERELAPLHWVIIPPLPSREEALSLFRRIQREGIDSYLVTEGEQENAISLGLFESRSAAEGVLAERNEKNLDAVLAFFPRNQISYALVFRAVYVPESKEQTEDLAEFERRFEMVKISRCEGVATAEKSP